MMFSDTGPSFSSFGKGFGNPGDRTLMITEALTASMAGQIAQQLAVLEAESADPIRCVMRNVPGGEAAAALSTYDVLRAATAPVLMLAGGRVAGPAVMAFVGAAAQRRYALPHARFRLEQPRTTADPGTAADVQSAAAAAADPYRRMVDSLADATGQSAEQIEEDLSAKRRFEADEAVSYGLVEAVVESRREME